MEHQADFSFDSTRVDYTDESVQYRHIHDLRGQLKRHYKTREAMRILLLAGLKELELHGFQSAKNKEASDAYAIEK
jgi:hypothetical protein